MPSNTVEFLGQYLDLVIKYKFNNSYNNGSNSRKLEDKSNLGKNVKDCNENKIDDYKTHVKNLNNCSYCDTEDNFKTRVGSCFSSPFNRCTPILDRSE